MREDLVNTTGIEKKCLWDSRSATSKAEFQTASVWNVEHTSLDATGVKVSTFKAVPIFGMPQAPAFRLCRSAVGEASQPLHAASDHRRGAPLVVRESSSSLLITDFEGSDKPVLYVLRLQYEHCEVMCD